MKTNPKCQARRLCVFNPFQNPLCHITSQCIYGFKSSHSPTEVGFGTIVVRTSKTSESGYSKKKKKKNTKTEKGLLVNKTKKNLTGLFCCRAGGTARQLRQKCVTFTIWTSYQRKIEFCVFLDNVNGWICGRG